MLSFQAPRVAPIRPVISTAAARQSVGTELSANAVGAAASGAWVGANRALYIPLYLERGETIAKLWWLNGATASGNVDIGLYRADFSKIVSAGSTAQGTINVVQEVDIADIYLPGSSTYYLGFACDNGTATFYRYNTGNALVQSAMGALQQATAFPLPSPAVPAANIWGYIPVCGISTRTLVA